MIIGFIGLGRMGELMSANLERAGFQVQTWDKAKRGNRPSARDAASGADVLITMVPDGKAVADAVMAALPGVKRGAGHATKALNNYLGAASTIAGFEALLIGKAFGLDPKTLVDVINASTGKNSTTERKIPQQILTKAFASGFKLALMSKDVGIAAQLADDTAVPAPYLKQTLRHWRNAERALPAGADHTEIYKYLERLTRRRAPPRRKPAPSRGAASPRPRSRPRRRRST